MEYAYINKIPCIKVTNACKISHYSKQHTIQGYSDNHHVQIEYYGFVDIWTNIDSDYQGCTVFYQCGLALSFVFHVTYYGYRTYRYFKDIVEQKVTIYLDLHL